MTHLEFRGMSIYSKTWVCGYVEFSVDKTSAWISKSREDAWSVKELYPVIPKTVGLYTGVIDKNGKKIYEWDRIRSTYTSDSGEKVFEGVIIFDCGMFVFANKDTLNGASLYSYVTRVNPPILEVVGNVFE